MRILVLNWRDVRSPRAGGAETATYELLRRLAAAGHDVTWLTSAADGAASEEELDGVGVVRRGSEVTTRFHAPRVGARGGWDVVVEEVNTLPYLAPLWARAPVLLYVNQLAREVWWYEAPRALAAVGYVLEPLLYGLYRDVPAVTISRSTARDLRRLGLRRRIDVVPLAGGVPAADSLRPKRPDASLAVVGRLVPSKRVDHALRALADLRTTHADATLTVVGEGPERPELERLARELRLDGAVRFAGRVADDARTAILADATAVVGCSAREGWGLTVTEAAAAGTPAVVYDVPGFRDSVADDRTGLLAAPSPAALADAVRRLLADAARYERLRAAAWEEARSRSWDVAARAFERAVAAAAAADPRPR